jgi:hypothetical protein
MSTPTAAQARRVAVRAHDAPVTSRLGPSEPETSRGWVAAAPAADLGAAGRQVS